MCACVCVCVCDGEKKQHGPVEILDIMSLHLSFLSSFPSSVFFSPFVLPSSFHLSPLSLRLCVFTLSSPSVASRGDFLFFHAPFASGWHLSIHPETEIRKKRQKRRREEEEVDRKKRKKHKWQKG